MVRVVLLGLAIAAVAAVNEGIARDGTGYGAGTISCGEWQQHRVSGYKSNSYQAQAWIDGFLSGLNMTADSGPDFLVPKPDPVAYYAWIDNYCREKPLDPLAQAALALKKELAARARRAD
jgi:hypothetical protein